MIWENKEILFCDMVLLDKLFSILSFYDVILKFNYLIMLGNWL